MDRNILVHLPSTSLNKIRMYIMYDDIVKKLYIDGEYEIRIKDIEIPLKQNDQIVKVYEKIKELVCLFKEEEILNLDDKNKIIFISKFNKMKKIMNLDTNNILNKNILKHKKVIEKNLSNLDDEEIYDLLIKYEEMNKNEK